MAIVKRLVKGSALTYAELDGNFDHLTAADAAHIDDTSGAHASSAISYTRNGTGATASTVYAKLNQSISPLDFGAVGDGSTDDTTAIQATIDYAETIGGIVDGQNLTYAISSKVSIGGGLAIGFQNFNLKAIAGTWPTGADGAMIKIAIATNYDDTNFAFQNVNCNCNDQAKTGWYMYRIVAKASFIDCHTWYFSEYGFWIKATGDGNSDIRFIGCSSAERLWTADAGDAFNVYADRTAYAWYVDYSADVEFIDCVGYGSLRALVIDGTPYNNQFIGCKFWNGPVRTEATSVTVEIIAGERNQFTGCRFDDGSVLLKTFSTQFNGCLFIQYDAGSQLVLEATSADEDAAGLALVGCRFNGTTPTELTTSGSGTWATKLLATVVGNTKIDGTPVTLNTWEFQSGAVRYKNGTYVFGDGVSAEELLIDGAAGANRLCEFGTAGLKRWAVGADLTSESGSNAGSDFAIYRYSDAGAYVSNPILIKRDTGAVVFGGGGGVLFYIDNSPPSLDVNGYMTFEKTNDTTLTIKVRGGDGTTRSVALTLAP